MNQNQQEDLGKAQKSGAHPRGLASIGPGWSLRIPMFYKFPSAAAAAGLGTTLGELMQSII